MKVRHPIVLASCLLFVVGVAVCLGLRLANEEEASKDNYSSSTNVEVDSAPVIVSAKRISSNAPSKLKLLDRGERNPRVFVPGEEWNVTIWYQSLPPQQGATYDPREYVAQRMGLTNR
jgi:hypothetical protein